MKSEPVFPCKVPTGELHANGDPVPTRQHYGMTLRDYFAAKAMQALVSKRGGLPEYEAKTAYEMADAMLKARSA